MVTTLIFSYSLNEISDVAASAGTAALRSLHALSP